MDEDETLPFIQTVQSKVFTVKNMVKPLIVNADHIAHIGAYVAIPAGFHNAYYLLAVIGFIAWVLYRE